MKPEKLFTVIIRHDSGLEERRTRVFENEQKFLCQRVAIEKGKRNSEWVVEGNNNYVLKIHFADQTEYARPLLVPVLAETEAGLADRFAKMVADCEEKGDYSGLLHCLELHGFIMRLGQNLGGYSVEIKREAGLQAATGLLHNEPPGFDLKAILNLAKNAVIGGERPGYVGLQVT